MSHILGQTVLSVPTKANVVAVPVRLHWTAEEESVEERERERSILTRGSGMSAISAVNKQNKRTQCKRLMHERFIQFPRLRCNLFATLYILLVLESVDQAFAIVPFNCYHSSTKYDVGVCLATHFLEKVLTSRSFWSQLEWLRDCRVGFYCSYDLILLLNPKIDSLPTNHLIRIVAVYRIGRVQDIWWLFLLNYAARFVRTTVNISQLA